MIVPRPVRFVLQVLELPALFAAALLISGFVGVRCSPPSQATKSCASAVTRAR